MHWKEPYSGGAYGGDRPENILENAPALGQDHSYQQQAVNGEYDYKVHGGFSGRWPSPSHLDQRIFITFAGGTWRKYINLQPDEFCDQQYVRHLYSNCGPGHETRPGSRAKAAGPLCTNMRTMT